MLNKLSKIFAPRSRPQLPSVPDGTRYYVIGDIHGCLDQYTALIDAIEEDDAGAKPADTRVVLLGDLVDRGPDSAGVIERTRKWQKKRNVRVLAGNHEEMFLQSFEKPDILRHFLKHGGRETILSYGISKKQFNAMTLDEMHALLPQIVPQSERDYIESFEEMIIAGDYVFVHAGIDPSQPLDAQKRSDLFWIRDRFLSHEGPLEKVVVHGHTIFDTVMDCGNRIGVDTGAFRSGVLTALVLEGDERRIIQTATEGDQITVQSAESTR
ncbi:metallophosphoesterase family protein [Erythrobacter crassostreae]|uniref:Serine/threonine protein phosphatase n=1 Tax=Erythrobacter crassostreae TaxID=2828328 RepID=A0A9X1F2P8_9SPHN|nr:metallophosphoesterase family protein [Erythrobacter crassostrea]MBV7259197.1 serine/threonine protein phosphatase [Erythrobacter crassostrea]